MKNIYFTISCLLLFLMGCTAPPAPSPIAHEKGETITEQQPEIPQTPHVEKAVDIPSGNNLLGDTDLTKYSAYMNDRAYITYIPNDHSSDTLQLTVTNASGQPWGAEIKKPLPVAVHSGDVALVRFKTRCISSSDETGEGILAVFCQKATSNWDKSLSVTLSIGSEWQEYLLPFKYIDSYDAGKSDLTFGVGSINQCIEIKDVSLTGYRNSMTVEELPKTQLTYAGQKPDAAWRKEAQQRIEQIRKGTLIVNVVDQNNQPVDEADININMQKHAFPFGTAVVPCRVIHSDEDSEKYKTKLKELFNAVVTENALKWEAWAGEWGEELASKTTLKGLQWIKDNGFYIRGHALVWPSWKNLPAKIETLKDTPDDLPRIIREHITEMCTATQGTIDEWDVLNEPYDNHDIMDIFGNEIMIDWFKQARAELPTTPLYINDYSILAAGGRDTQHQNHYEQTARFLLDNGAPITGLGFQSHFSADLTPPTRVLSLLDKYAKLGLDLKITEFDVNTQDEALQADYTRDFMTATFSHPAITGFFVWGFWAGAHWREEAALFRKDWTQRPALQAYKQLVFNEWWTNLKGKTDANGTYQDRGFYGDYTISASKDKKQVSQSFTLTPDTKEITIILK